MNEDWWKWPYRQSQLHPWSQHHRIPNICPFIFYPKPNLTQKLIDEKLKLNHEHESANGSKMKSPPKWSSFQQFIIKWYIFE